MGQTYLLREPQNFRDPIRDVEGERERERAKKPPATFNETLITHPFLERIREGVQYDFMASFDGFVWATKPFSIDRNKLRRSHSFSRFLIAQHHHQSIE